MLSDYPNHLYQYTKVMHEWLDSKELKYTIVLEQGKPRYFGFETKEEALHCKLIAMLKAEG